MSHVTQDLVTSIDERLAHARAEIACLEAALAAFDTPAVPVGDRQPTRGQLTDVAPISTTGHRPRSAGNTPGQSQPGPSRSRRAQPARDGDVDAERLQALLGEHNGLTTTAIVQHTAANRIRILAVLRRLETDGQIRRTGVRRSTRWHVITDENRVAQRAAHPSRPKAEPPALSPHAQPVGRRGTADPASAIQIRRGPKEGARLTV